MFLTLILTSLVTMVTTFR